MIDDWRKIVPMMMSVLMLVLLVSTVVMMVFPDVDAVMGTRGAFFSRIKDLRTIAVLINARQIRRP